LSEHSDTPDFSSLRFIRVFTPDHIPRYLVEQLKDRAFEVDRFYEYLNIECIVNTDAGPKLNQYNFLYVVATPENKVVGFLWAVIDPLGNNLIINNFSMDREYWYRGRSVRLLEAKAKELQATYETKNIFWFTRYPKHSKYYGFKESSYILMEYKPDEVNDARDRRKNRVNKQL
jgi:hypothetical protein